LPPAVAEICTDEVPAGVAGVLGVTGALGEVGLLGLVLVVADPPPPHPVTINAPASKARVATR
jgi:hypothetical protein